MPRIVFKKDELPPVDLNQEVIFGRSEKHSNVVVNDNRLSRAHCRMEAQADGTWTVTDLDSQNGTFVNGRRIKECMIKAGDVIRIGAVDMLFEAIGLGGATVMAGVESGRMGSATASKAPRAGGLDLADDSVATPTINTVEGTRTVIAPAALVLLKGTLADKIHPLVADLFTIGRKKDNLLCLEGDGKASGYHAHIRKDGDDFIVEDLGSMNGVSVNGEKITGPTLLKTGSKLIVGQQVFKFQFHGKPEESSGETAPQLASEDVAKAMKDAEPPEPAVASESEPPMTESSGDDAPESAQEDMSALTQKISYKGGGGGLFSIIEIIVAVAVVGGILYAGWTFSQSKPPSSGDEQGSFPPVRDGKLLAKNPSFEDGGQDRILKNWIPEAHGTDSVAVVEGGHGGQFALQLSRFSPSNGMTVVFSEAFELKGEEGLKVSAFAINGEAVQKRYGTAVVSIWWLAHKDDQTYMLATPVAVATNLNEWTEISGSCKRPPAARAYRIVLGITGQKGSVAFDDIQVSKDDNAPAMFAGNTHSADGLRWKVEENGTISFGSDSSALLQYGAIYLYPGENRGDPLDPLLLLTAAPSAKISGGALVMKYPYFDPLAAKPVQLSLVLKINDGQAEFSATVQSPEGKGLEGVALRIGFSALCTTQFAPDKILRFNDDKLMAFENEIGGKAGKDFQKIVAANTGTGNSISNKGGRGKIRVASMDGGRYVSVLSRGTLNFGLSLGHGRDDVAERAALSAALQAGETQVDRVNRALSIFKDYPYCQPELQQAADAIDAVANHYKLRLIELRDGLNELTGNEQLYRAAMTEAINNADLLKEARPDWEASGRGALEVF
ncbi:MAG: FHA domain-containing protein, partial [Planctomycetes bacterium]|nr:FHA domain-containing protein [Planctomycetota bacterium]